jgi:hypothetical protein
MAELSEAQRRTRRRVESLIGMMAPALDAVLAVGERVSRVVEPEDHGYYPARPMPGDEPVESAPSPSEQSSPRSSSPGQR